jgi:hypothetical protein
MVRAVILPDVRRQCIALLAASFLLALAACGNEPAADAAQGGALCASSTLSQVRRCTDNATSQGDPGCGNCVCGYECCTPSADAATDVVAPAASFFLTCEEVDASADAPSD